jgi:hypothetical protein
MALDREVLAARIDVRVCELRLLAAVTAVEFAHGKTIPRPAPRPAARPAPTVALPRRPQSQRA